MFKMLAITVTKIQEIFDFDESSSSSSSESEDDFTTAIIVANCCKKRKITATAVAPTRIVNYFERVIPNFTEKQFKMHFRMTLVMFEETLSLLGPIMAQQNLGRPVGNTRKKLLAIIWLLATPDSFRSVGDRFNLSKGNLCDDFVRVIKALNNVANQFIKWPTNEERRDIKIRFQRFAGFRDVIGAVDGTHIPIKAPKQDPEVYITRKSQYAMTLQCIAIPSLKFTDTFVGYPGSVSDTRIFRNSYIYHRIQNNVNEYCSNSFILGDKAYPVLSWLIPPYIERRQLSPIQRNFNTHHARTRQVVERSFALLFGRFRRLKYLDMNRTDLIPATVNACCVLHNICIEHLEAERDDYINEGRQFLINNADQVAIADGNNQQDNYNIRDMLAQELFENAINE